MEHRDAVVVGAGPAGSTCAWRLRQAGVDVLLLDRHTFPRDKSCAGWITPRVLDALGLSPDEYGAGRIIEPIGAFRVGLIGGAALDVPFGRPVSYGIRRSEFDDLLVARSGADFRPGTPLTSLERDGNGWIVNGQIATPMAVGAGGHFCPVARALNPHAGDGSPVVTREAEIELDSSGACPVPPGVPEFYFARDFRGYGWVFRKGRFVTIGLGLRGTRHIREHLRDFVDFLCGAGRAPDLRTDSWRGHTYLLYGSSPRRTVADGALLVGDAAGLAGPRSGEGIRPAIESGLLAAETIVAAAGDYRAASLGVYNRRLTERLGPARTGRSLRRLLPSSVEHALGRRLLQSRWFARHVVLERWFLHQ